MRRHQTRWGLYGLLLAPGAPIGLWLVLWLMPVEPPPWTAVYLYVGLATAIVFTGFGLAAGRLMDQLRAVSVRDSLTGVYTRRFLVPSIEAALATAARTGSELSILMMDLDHFKRVNDEHGHGVGDQTLGAVARVLEANSRAGDLLARYGGEEFVLMCPNTGEDAARALAERLRAAVRSLDGPTLGFEGTQTISIGVASTKGTDRTPSDLLLSRADVALYDAKRAGRDQVRVAAADCVPETSNPPLQSRSYPPRHG